jgi:hypothetical protein
VLSRPLVEIFSQESLARTSFEKGNRMKPCDTYLISLARETGFRRETLEGNAMDTTAADEAHCRARAISLGTHREPARFFH